MTESVSRHRFDLQAAGRRLHVERIEPGGSAGGPTLVFLHEGLGSISQWKDFPAQLCALTGLPGLVYERWGFGHSEALDQPRTPRYLYHEALDSLPEVLERGQISSKPILIGHSDGGSIALLFAASYPDRPLGIITEAAHVFVEEITLRGIRNAVHLYETTDLPQRLARHHGDKTESIFRGWSDIWLSSAFRDWNIEAELTKINCPTLIIQGEDDEYGTPAQVETIAKQVPGPVKTLLIPNCAHVPHHQAPDRVLAEMGRFIACLLQ